MAEKIKGLPVALMIPATMYDLIIIEKDINIDIPISGKYEELFPDFTTEHDEFNCMGTLDDSDTVFVDMHTITNVLFASSKYPKLESDTFFTITAFLLNKETHTLTIVGSILKFDDGEGDG